MILAIDIAIAIIVLVGIAATYRMLAGPTDADRAVGGDLLLFGLIGLVALVGVRIGSTATFDIVLVAALLGFLTAISLARILTRGRR
ncbi:monovalent cation/H+ antiporter complex subunit F [Marisediminicola sp. LYQ134]|uniref:monovalent cation/H+ antiporter complex subunit F n=1 Tax=unclassified Marisediminicola TaxID=2618316 RepID=UPI00398324FA